MRERNWGKCGVAECGGGGYGVRECDVGSVV